MIPGELLLRRRVLVCAGAGGAGKTTVAAALGLLAAERGLRVVVVTIDPARRLAGALGLADLRDTPEQVPLDAPGELHAMMLVQKPAWDRLITAHAPSPALAERLFANPFYQRFSREFAGAHAYAAVDTLCALEAEGSFDLVVVDTPPMRHALELFHAPARVLALLEDGALPAALEIYQRSRSGRTEGVTRAARWLVGRLEDAAGAHTLRDAADFLGALAEMFDVFSDRAREMQALLRGDRLGCVLVATPDERALGEARRFLDETGAIGLHTDALFLNRSAAGALAGDTGEAGLDGLERLLDRDAAAFVAANLDRYRGRARVERARVARLLDGHAGIACTFVPELESDVHDLAGLAQLGRALMGQDAGR